MKTMGNSQKPKYLTYLLLQLFLLFYSFGGIVVKRAATCPFFSITFILYYGLEIIILVFYAIGWQQFIKRMPLSAVYAIKSVTVIWGCVWGVLIFHEHLTAGKVIGSLLVLTGVAFYGFWNGKEKDKSTKETAVK